jgi:hypothetical protein
VRLLRRQRRDPRDRPRRRRPVPHLLLRAGLVVGAVLVLLSLVAAWRLAGVYRDLDKARGLLEHAGALLEDGELAASAADLRSAESLLVQANNQLFTSPELDVLSWMPVFQQNLRSVRDSLGVTLRLVDGGRELLATAEPLQDAQGSIEVPLRDGAVPVDTIGAAAGIADSLASELPAASERPSTALLLSPVRTLADRVYEEAARRRQQLDSVGRALTLLDELSGADGHRRFLIAVANTAEMRGTGGMILSYGVLESEAGQFSLTAFGNIDELFLDVGVNPTNVGLPEDFMDRWASVEPTRLWRAANVGADFDLSALTMEGMYFRKTGLVADGVIQVDPHGLAAIMRAIGPVSVEEFGDVNAGNVVDLTLNQAYVQFPDREVRQSLLGDVAEAVFTKLLNGRYDSLRSLGTELLGAAAERHLQFHSIRLRAQNPARFFGATGELPDPGAEYALLTVQNFSANKLDYYLDTAVAIEGSRPPGQAGRYAATITLTNNAPPGAEPAYIFGPNIEGAQNGVYRGVVSLYVPGGAALVDSGGDPVVDEPVLTSENGRSVVVYQVEVPAGSSRTVTLDLQLPAWLTGPYSLQLVPAPRVRPTSYFVEVAADGSTVASSGPVTRLQQLQQTPQK